jgi:hypothetical protein
MNKAQKRTVVFLAVYVLVGVGYDVWTAWHDGASSTISWIISWIAQQYWGASIVIALAYLMGHFFAQDKRLDL